MSMLPHARSSLIVAAILVVVACQGPAASSPGSPGASPGGSPGASPPSGTTTRLSIATGGTGGVYYPYGGGLAAQITAGIPGVEATAEVTNASVDNMNLIGAGSVDLAFVLGDTASDALTGKGAFEGKPVQACTLGKLYTNYTQVVTSSDSGISTIAGLAGKRVSVGSPGSGTEIIALRVLEAAGIDPAAGIERSQLGVAESVAALRDGTIDAFFWSGGLPTGAIVDYATTGKLALIPTADLADELQGKFGAFYEAVDIPAGTYQGQSAAVATIGVPNVLVARPDLDEPLQHDITKLLFDRKAELVKVHPEAKNLDPTAAQEVDFMDLCPGAKRYYQAGG
ncbi:MAG TPA: TAXI family TRAP transporter solute-binding subunit [Candidatus Limnocylindrales bacterium]|nr:TAXI family TRAP transporter solute-binding subunit [Candidatus Limnocylindrales bacterium]